MLHVNKIIAQGRGLAAALLRRAATVELDWDTRQKSRFDATDSSGRHLGVFLPRGSVVRGGDVLVAEDGSLVRVLAAPQPVLRVTPCPEHGTALRPAARGLPPRQPARGRSSCRPTTCSSSPTRCWPQMLRAMHLIVTEVQAPFEPEGGAYAPQA